MRGVGSEGGGVYHEQHLPLVALVGEVHFCGILNVLAGEVVDGPVIFRGIRTVAVLVLGQVIELLSIFSSSRVSNLR